MERVIRFVLEREKGRYPGFHYLNLIFRDDPFHRRRTTQTRPLELRIAIMNTGFIISIILFICIIVISS